VAISFKEAEKYFKDKSKVVFTGNPIRSEMLEVSRETARKSLEYPKICPWLSYLEEAGVLKI